MCEICLADLNLSVGLPSYQSFHGWIRFSWMPRTFLASVSPVCLKRQIILETVD